MKGSTIFLGVLGAILVAAALIFGLKALVEQNQRTQSAYADLVSANAKADAWIAANKRVREKARGQSGIESTPPSNEVSPAETSQQTYYWSLSLTKPVELKDSVGRVIAKLEQGQSVQCIGRDNYVARIRYDGADYEIPISVTDLK